MFMKRLRVGLILVLLVALGGCQAGGVAKNVVFSQEQGSTDGTRNASYITASVQQGEAVPKAEAAFKKYLDIQDIDESLVLKAALIEDDGVLWMNPYWKLSWLGKDAEKPIYSAQIDAQTGEVIQLHYRPQWGYTAISKEDVLAYRDTALDFIDKYDLAGEDPLSIFEAYSSYREGISVEFRHAPDKFIALSFNEAGDITGFRRSQRVAYTLSGNGLQVDRAEAVKTAQASIEKYYGDVDSSGLIEDIGLFEGNKGEKTWFVYWKNIAVLEGRYVRYGAQIDAVSGKICAVEGTNHLLGETAAVIDEEKQREIADRFVEQKNLSDYRFEAFDTEMGSVRYKDKTGSPLHVFVDRCSGSVNFLSFIELK